MLQYLVQLWWIGFVFFASLQFTRPQDSSCVGDASIASLEALFECFDNHVVREYTRETYELAQPSESELSDWTKSIVSLLNGTCSTGLPESVSNDYTSIQWSDYCILYEVNVPFRRGWGTFAVPLKSEVPCIGVHLAAPHPVFDGRTSAQVAFLFNATRARSLLVSGRIRQALPEATNCIEGGTNYVTDPTHDDNEPFHAAAVAIKNWQDTHGGCSADKCAYIQIHGKGPNTCTSDGIFLSSGIGSSSWYTSSNIASQRINRLQANLADSYPDWNISTPANSSCGLVAATNVFGRYVNGVARDEVCEVPAKVEDVSGDFIHAEQAYEIRQVGMEDGWVTALLDTFKPG